MYKCIENLSIVINNFFKNYINMYKSTYKTHICIYIKIFTVLDNKFYWNLTILVPFKGFSK